MRSTPTCGCCKDWIAILQREGLGKFNAYSAGSQPKGEVHPYALDLLKQLNHSTKGFRSKNWDEFAVEGAPKLDFVFTVCDNAAAEVCPVWPGQPMTAHWGVPDPAAVEGSDAQKTKAFMDTAITLKRRIELMLALPLNSLADTSLQREVDRIGKAGA